MKSIDELDKQISRPLYELILTTLTAFTTATNLTSGENNAVCVGVIQNVYADLIASAVAGAENEEAGNSIRSILRKSLDGRIDSKVVRMKRVHELADKLLSGASARKIAADLVEDFNDTPPLPSEDGDDESGKGPAGGCGLC